MEQNLHTNRKQEGAREDWAKEDISTSEKKKKQTESAKTSEFVREIKLVVCLKKTGPNALVR